MATKKDIKQKIQPRKGSITVTVVKTIDEFSSTLNVEVDVKGVEADTDQITGMMFAAMCRVEGQATKQAEVPADDKKSK